MSIDPEKQTTPRDVKQHMLITLQQKLTFALRILAPSFLTSAVHDNDIKTSTSYLNGLRGLVAVLVFIRNVSSPYHPTIDCSYGQADLWDWYRLPVTRFLYAGPWVPVMFVVSGYVTSIKALQLLDVDHLAFHHTLVHILLRRPLRLFLPSVIASFMVFLVVVSGGCEYEDGHFRGHVPLPEVQSSLAAQLDDWLNDVVSRLLNPWSWAIRLPKYGSHLWTLPIQFRGTLLSVLVLLLIARVPGSRRRWLVMVVALGSFFWGRWDAALFLGGIFVCACDVAGQSPLGSQALLSPGRLRHISKVLWMCYLYLGVHLGAFPRHQEGQAGIGYEWLSSITRDYHYWAACGAIIIVHAITRLGTLQEILDHHTLQYLGKVSYSLYLVHVPFFLLLGDRIWQRVWSMMGDETQIQYQMGFLIGLVINLPLVLWVADVFWRCIERECSRLSGFLEGRLLR